MEAKKSIFLIFFIYIFLFSCGTKTIIDDSIQLKGPILFKYTLSNHDSIVHKGTEIKMSFTIPNSITTADGIVIDNIVKADFGHSPIAEIIDSSNNSAFNGSSYNFIKGSGDKGRAAMYFYGGTGCEDTYVCRDTGIFWFNFVSSPTKFKFWTQDGKVYSIGATVTFDVPDMHSAMLIRNCPSVEYYLSVLQDKGFGYYCFKVVP